MELEKIQQEIRNQKLDGWLFFDHHNRDMLAYRVLGLPVTKGPSRRWYYMIPAQGGPMGMETPCAQPPSWSRCGPARS